MKNSRRYGFGSLLGALLCSLCVGCSPTKDADIWESYALQDRTLPQDSPLVPLPRPGETSREHEGASKEHTTPSTPSHATSSHAAQGPAAAEVLAELLSGNKRFYEQKALYPNQNLQRRASLASGQKPKAIVLSCSDSRVPPELIFDQGLGDLFIVRTAGEVADSAALASIEYAIEHLGSSLLLVLGHESCGAVKATLETPAKQSAGSKHLDFLLGQIRPNISTGKSQNSESPLSRAVRENVNGAARALAKNSKIIAHAVAHDKLLIAHGVYQLSTGRVEVWF